MKKLGDWCSKETFAIETGLFALVVARPARSQPWSSLSHGELISGES
jgi:hypothetical protein